MQLNHNKIIVISGPSASGKSAYGMKLAKKNNGVIINADSMQIYKGLPILSAQPSENDKKEIKHLLYSHLNPYEKCDVGLWLKLVSKAIEDTISKGQLPIIIGGTGMYISKLIYGIARISEIPEDTRNKIVDLYKNTTNEELYKISTTIDKKTTNKINKNDRQRLLRILEIYETTGKTLNYFRKLENFVLYPREKFYHININPDRETLYKQCDLRFNNMLKKDNVLEEIKIFLTNYPEIANNIHNFSISNTIGLMEGIEHLNGKISIKDFLELSIKETKNYIKRQYTWFNHQFLNFDLQIVN